MTPRHVLTTKAVLFDLDGTLVDSSGLFDVVWTDWAKRMGIDPARIMAVHHGRRMVETIALVAPGLDNIAHHEQEILRAATATTDGLRLIPGAREILESIPTSRWAIVTSSYHHIVRDWFRHFGLPKPQVVVTSEDVTRGKPAPDCFRLGAEQLGYTASDCLVFEDAKAGIAAARAAGAQIVAIGDTTAASERDTEFWVPDFTVVRARMGTGDITLSLG